MEESCVNSNRKWQPTGLSSEYGAARSLTVETEDPHFWFPLAACRGRLYRPATTRGSILVDSAQHDNWIAADNVRATALVMRLVGSWEKASLSRTRMTASPCTHGSWACHTCTSGFQVLACESTNHPAEADGEEGVGGFVAGAGQDPERTHRTTPRRTPRAISILDSRLGSSGTTLP